MKNIFSIDQFISTTRSSFLSLFILFPLIASSSFAEPSSTVLSSPSSHPSVSASATSTVSLAATKAVVSLQVSRTAPTAKEASEKNAAASSTVLAFLKSQSSVKNLKTTGLQLGQVTRYDNVRNESVVTGYESSNSLQFETDIEGAGALIDGAIKNGVNTVQSVSFSAEDEALKQARLQAVAIATKDAKEEAEKAADAIHIAPTNIRTILVGQSASARPMPQEFFRSRGMAEMESAPATSLIAGNLSVTATVTVEMTW